MLNRSFKEFKFLHKKKQNQILFVSKKINNNSLILNLIENFLSEKNSFIFESVRKVKLKEDIQFLEKTLIKYGNLIITIVLVTYKIIK